MTSLRANTCVRTGRLRPRSCSATRVIENPKDVDSRLRLANFYASTQRREQMTAVLRRMLDDPQDFPRAHLLRCQEISITVFSSGTMQFANSRRVRRPIQKNRLLTLKRVTQRVPAEQGKGDEASAVVHDNDAERAGQ